MVLSNNKLTSLPESIGELTNLSYLDLSNNKLTSLPDESIGKLTNLTYLHLSNNKLTSLPESIGELTNLKYSNLFNNKLTSLPKSIGKLTNLTRLDLSNNKLTSLPENIGELTNLTYLYLFNNKLTSLPKSIGKLNLTYLNFRYNELTSLPKSIGKLNLTYLNLSNNKLTSLPESIGKLTNLKYLDLSANELNNLDFIWLVTLINKSYQCSYSISSNNWDVTYFRAAIMDNEDKNFREIMDEISYKFFPRATDRKEATKPLELLGIGWQRRRIEQNHQFYLESGKNVGRAIYSTIVGFNLIKLTNNINNSSTPSYIFILLGLFFIVLFTTIAVAAYRTEEASSKYMTHYQLVGSKNDTIEEYANRIFEFLTIKQDLTNSRFTSIMGYCVNQIIVSATSLLFFIASTNDTEIPSENHYDFLSFSLFERDFIILFIFAIFIGSIIILVVYKIKQNRLPVNYQSLLQKYIKEDPFIEERLNKVALENSGNLREKSKS